MNVRALARTALIGLATLAGLATASANDEVWTLLADSGEHTGLSVVHRIDSSSGQYLGYFGAGLLKHAGAIAVCDPGRARSEAFEVFVADDEGIKDFEGDDGKYLGGIPYDVPGKAVAMTFGVTHYSSQNDWKADPDLFAVFQTDSTHYRIRRYHTATHALLAESAPMSAFFNGPVSITCGGDGSMHVTYTMGGLACDDRFTGDLSQTVKPAFTDRSVLFATDLGVYRDPLGPFIRALASGETRWGITGLNPGVHLGAMGYGRYVGIAPGDEFHYTTMVSDINPMLVRITNYFVWGWRWASVSQGDVPFFYASFKHDAIRGVAYYTDPFRYNDKPW